ncbi:Protein of unknown function (DUF4246) domain containing protein [Rhypophila sp. PSN 637]
MRFPRLAQGGAAAPWHRGRLPVVLYSSAGSRAPCFFRRATPAAADRKPVINHSRHFSFHSSKKIMGFASRPYIAGNHEYRYPGIDLPLCQSDEGAYEISGHLNLESPKDPSRMLQIREVAMMILMDRLTDKPKWHEKVFDKDIVAAWRRDTFAQSEEPVYMSITQDANTNDLRMPARTRIISEKAFDNCIAELRNKAAFFKETGLTPTLDADRFAIFKSDTLVTSDLHQALHGSFSRLIADQATNPDWHPGTDDIVWDVVHPSMYPFVYNRSRFIHDEVVGVTDAIDRWSGKGQIPVQNLSLRTKDPWSILEQRDLWSEKYQWLPANLAFQQDGSVRFTSYINNLHPQQYPETYSAIENLIDIAIPAWDRSLDWNWNHKASFSRFDPPPTCHELTPEEETWEKFDPEVLKAVEQDAEVPYEERDVWDYIEQMHHDELEEAEDNADQDTTEKLQKDAIPQVKWRKIRDPVLPEPDHIRSYDSHCRENIREKFRERGLQVIVKMASIELTPEKPTLPAGGWHVEGQLNEYIVATALYYIDEENIEPTTLSFRQPTSPYQDELQNRVGQDMYQQYSQIFGVSLGYAFSADESPCLQYYGSVETKPGRLLVFPNTFHHRVSECTLKDKTKPGHRRFIALWLVNPEMRIISTANVPPQQLDWWLGSVIGDVEKGAKGQIPQEILQLVPDTKRQDIADETKTDMSAESMGKLRESDTSKLSTEILNRIRDHETLDALMTVEEARQHRLALMVERSRFHQAGEQNIQAYLSFCEH